MLCIVAKNNTDCNNEANIQLDVELGYGFTFMLKDQAQKVLHLFLDFASQHKINLVYR